MNASYFSLVVEQEDLHDRVPRRQSEFPLDLVARSSSSRKMGRTVERDVG